ncbi:HPr family phosphocarrier protein [Pendulispora albinea]|uniref:HPr family phosphocarrier protein n=1 Tax=Pendulispora albinea TaxID=2741071 RepID=A0ABZ2LK83_9BACT
MSAAGDGNDPRGAAPACVQVDLELLEALHARPASMLVRLASRQTADVELVCEGRRANAKKILEVLRLGARRGSRLQLTARGEDAAASLEKLAELVRGGFVSDALPESGTAAALGMAVGRASWMRAPDLESPESLRGFAPISVGENAEAQSARLRGAFEGAALDLAKLIGALPPREAQLFEPELVILTELLQGALGHAVTETSAEAALDAAATEVRTERTDLVRDAFGRVRARLRGGAASGQEAHEALESAQGERILVTDTLTPSLLVSLPPSFSGIVASDHLGAGYTSHAAILARGRGLPLVFAPPHAVEAIAEDDVVVIESTVQSCHFWVSPSAEFVAKARARRDLWRTREAEEQARAAELSASASSPAALPAFIVRANVSARDERIPDVADGIGLLRTELLFAAAHKAPSELEQAAVYRELARRVAGKPCVVRLFDAGGDKPLAWLPAPPDDPDLRGIGLLFANTDVLRAQLRAIDRAHGAPDSDVRILVPMVRSADDVERVRRSLKTDIAVGSMIESLAAAREVDSIARISDFISIGTNDLASSMLGVDRTRGALTTDASLLAVIRSIVEGAHARGRKVTVCGELAGDALGARMLVGLGVDALSVTSARITPIKLALQGSRVDVDG